MGTYVVTGGCGFIGSHLADALLRAGHHVRIVDDLSTGSIAHMPAKAELVRGCITDARLMAAVLADADGCFHLAAIASVERCRLDWLGTHAVNLTGSVVVFEAARRAGRSKPAPVVYASSAAVYGDGADLPARERSPARPLSAYGADKLGTEQHAFVAGRVHGVPTCGLRLFNVYGPRQDPQSPYAGVVSVFADRLRRGLTLTIYGDGHQSRDFVHVADAVRALQAAMAHADTGGPIFNVCTGTATSVRDLARLVARSLGVRATLVHAPPRGGDIRFSIGDPRAAAQALGFKAAITPDAGIAATLSSLVETSAA